MQYLYLIKCQQFYKIGVANDVESRLAQLSTGNPFELEVLAVYGFANAQVVEAVLHQKFANTRKRGEWFELSNINIADFNQICELLDGSFEVMDNGLPTVDDAEMEEAEELDASLENVRTELRMSNGEPRGVVLLERGSAKKTVAYIGRNSEDFEKYLELYKRDHPNSKVLCGVVPDAE